MDPLVISACFFSYQIFAGFFGFFSVQNDVFSQFSVVVKFITLVLCNSTFSIFAGMSNFIGPTVIAPGVDQFLWDFCGHENFQVSIFLCGTHLSRRAGYGPLP
mmetsp:Transcript_45648/g.73614  ORF Transcript_45648/g.73614 Transcript_45648/m.73614 type:complete len:103 (+) Transcript_45648:209-517(+)